MCKKIITAGLILILACRLSGGQEFYSIERVPVSSESFDDFSPAFYRNGIAFTSNRTTSFLIARLTEEGENFFNIFYTEKEDEKGWKSPSMLSRELSSNFHDGPASFSADGNTVYFTRNIPARGRDEPRLGIFIASYINGSWRDITPFPYNSIDYNVGHPVISRDGKTLYFTSDMPGGYGGLDIYTCTIEGDAWGPPMNIGSTINSPGNEKFPFIHPNGRLYFSSDHNEKKSLDIYYSDYRNGEWMPPVPLPEPFNSDYDDFGYIAGENLDESYFSSNREGSDNLYHFHSTFPLFTQCDSLKENDYCFIFYEKRGENVDTTGFYFEWDMGDGTIIHGLEAEHCFDTTGTYIITLNVMDKITGEVMTEMASYEFLLENIEQPYITSPDTAFVDESVTFDSRYTFLKNFQIEEFYWDMGDGTKYSGNIAEHAYEHPGEYIVTLGVTSSPDSPFGERKACVYKTIVILEEE